MVIHDRKEEATIHEKRTEDLSHITSGLFGVSITLLIVSLSLHYQSIVHPQLIFLADINLALSVVFAFGTSLCIRRRATPVSRETCHCPPTVVAARLKRNSSQGWTDVGISRTSVTVTCLLVWVVVVLFLSGSFFLLLSVYIPLK